MTNSFQSKAKQIMKKLVIALLFFSVAIGSSQAQSIVKLDPISLAFGQLRAGYEKFSDKNSIYVGASYISRNFFGVKYSGAGVFGQYRWYLSDVDTPKGIFVGPHVGFNYISFNNSFTENFSYSALRLGGIIGYQGTIGTNFTWEVGIGPSYGLTFGSGDSFTNLFGSGIVPVSSFAVGYVLD